MSFWIDDLDLFFSDFAISADWNGKEIKIIFHNAYEAATLFGQDIESKDPYVEAQDSDVEGLVHGDVLEINSVSYQVREIRPDGTGITAVMLTKVN